MKVQHKNILITGGARGIGAAMSRRFAAEGASAIAIADLDFRAATSLAAELARPGIKTKPIAVDVSNPAQVQEMIGILRRSSALSIKCVQTRGSTWH